MSIIARKAPGSHLKKIRVDISQESSQWFLEVAEGRIKRARDEDRPQMHGQLWEDKPKDMRIGCRAEGAAAQHYGLVYDPGPDPDFHDVGETEVRGTPYYTGHLLGHDGKEERTKQDMIFILCISPLDESHVLIIGWCYGYELFKPELWGDHWNKGRPCYAKPQSELKDMSRLVCIDGIISER